MEKIKGFNEFLNELNIDTYANLMDRTEGYPWKTFLSNDKDKSNPRTIYNKHNRINHLSRKRFEEEFYKEFPQGSVEIKTSEGEFVFKSIKFNTNYTNYDLIFTNVEKTNLWVKVEHNGYYITLSGKKVTVSDQESIDLLSKMSKYHSFRK